MQLDDAPRDVNASRRLPEPGGISGDEEKAIDLAIGRAGTGDPPGKLGGGRGFNVALAKLWPGGKPPPTVPAEPGVPGCPEAFFFGSNSKGRCSTKRNVKVRKFFRKERHLRLFDSFPMPRSNRQATSPAKTPA